MRAASRPAVRLGLSAVSVGGLIALQVVLARWAAFDVRQSFDYQALFLLVGVAWLALAWHGLWLLGLSPADDAIESDNPAAAVTVGGAWLGALACYVGANIGEGDTIWTTIGPAGVATVLWLALALCLEWAARPVEAITIDRDLASGFRLGSLLLGNGIVLGAAAAGDYVSVGDTIRSFWPGLGVACALTLLVAGAQRVWRPTPERPARAALVEGFVPGLAVLLAAVAWVVSWGA